MEALNEKTTRLEKEKTITEGFLDNVKKELHEEIIKGGVNVLNMQNLKDKISWLQKRIHGYEVDIEKLKGL